MNHLVIAHGKPKEAAYHDPRQPRPPQSHWFPWLAAQAAQRGIPANIPAFPEPYAPDYEKWQSVFNPIAIGEKSGIVSFSAGAGFGLRWLSEHPELSIERFVMVGLWHDRQHRYGRDFFNYTPDPRLAERIGKITMIHASGDVDNYNDVQAIREAVPGIEYIEVNRDDHFRTHQLPLLLDIVFDP